MDNTSSSWQGSFCLAPADNPIRSLDQTFEEMILCIWPGAAQSVKLFALCTFSVKLPPQCSISSPLETLLYSELKGRAEDYLETSVISKWSQTYKPHYS